MNKLKLLSIKKSTRPEKKLMAVFDNDGRTKTVHFGASGMYDYTKKHHDKERKERYLARHKGMGEHWEQPDTAGALSKWVLWNKPTIEASIKDYKKHFKL